MVKHLPTVRETWVQSLGQEDPLKKDMATHSSTLAWKIPWTEEHNRLQSMGSQRVRHYWATSLHFIKMRMPQGRGWNISENHWLPTLHTSLCLLVDCCLKQLLALGPPEEKVALCAVSWVQIKTFSVWCPLLTFLMASRKPLRGGRWPWLRLATPAPPTLSVVHTGRGGSPWPFHTLYPISDWNDSAFPAAAAASLPTTGFSLSFCLCKYFIFLFIE